MEDHKPSILKTLSFFAAQDVALTTIEVRDFLLGQSRSGAVLRLSQIERELEKLITSKKVVSQDGLHTLISRAELIEKKKDHYTNALRLMRRARSWAAGLRHFPYVRAVAVSGSTAQLNASPMSDIDLFIIVEPGRMFFARLLVSAYFQILGMRRHGDYIAQRFCLNHYIASGLQMPQDRNEYTALLYRSFLTIFGYEHIRDFWFRNLPWIENFFQHNSPPDPPIERYPERSLAQLVLESVLDPFALLLERGARYFQKQRIIESEYVIVSDTQLSFHPDSKGQKVLRRFRDIQRSL